MLTIQQLEILLAIEKTGSLRKAADVLFLSQPALSVAIKKMEDELETQLFIRKSTGIELTPICKKILPIAGEVITQMKKLDAVCSEYVLMHQKVIPNSSIILRAYPLIATSFFPKLIFPLKEMLPNLKIDTKNISMEESLQLKSENELILYIEHVEEDDLENSCINVEEGANSCRICSIHPCINMHKEYFPQVLSAIKDTEVIKHPLLVMFRENPTVANFSGKLLEHLDTLDPNLNLIDCSSISVVKAYIDAKMGVGIGWYFTSVDRVGWHNATTNGNYVSVPLEYESKMRFYLSVKYSSSIPNELIVLLRNVLLDCVYELNGSIIP